MWTASESVLTRTCAHGDAGGCRSCIAGGTSTTRPRRRGAHQDALLVAPLRTSPPSLCAAGERLIPPLGLQMTRGATPRTGRVASRMASRPPARVGARRGAAPDDCAALSPRRSRAPLPPWSQRCARTTTDTNAQQTRGAAILDTTAEERMRDSPQCSPRSRSWGSRSYLITWSCSTQTRGSSRGTSWTRRGDIPRAGGTGGVAG